MVGDEHVDRAERVGDDTFGGAWIREVGRGVGKARTEAAERRDDRLDPARVGSPGLRGVVRRPG